MSTINFLLVFKDHEVAENISNQLKSWNFNTPVLLHSLDEVLYNLNLFDVLLMDTSFKDGFEELLNQNKDHKDDLVLIYLDGSSEPKNTESTFLNERYPSLKFPFNFTEFKYAVETASKNKDLKNRC